MGSIKVDVSASGSTALLSAPGAGYKYVIQGYYLIADAAVGVSLKSASTTLDGPFAFPGNGGLSTGFYPQGLCETAANEALNLNLDAAVRVTGRVTYTKRKV